MTANFFHKPLDNPIVKCYNVDTEREVNTMTTIILELTCPFCGATHFVEVEESELLAYKNGALAQDAFKSLDATEREQIISRLCPTCQADIFGSEDEPSDEDFEDDGDLEMGFDPYEGGYTFDC